MKYKIRWYMDDEWEVIKVENWVYMEDPLEIIEYKGSLSDCEAFIRLKENGYFD